MLMLAVQSLLLILAAFIAGAMIACFMRRVFFTRDNEHPSTDPDGGHGSTTKRDETSTTTTIEKTTETRTVSATEASRFGRALTGASSAAGARGAVAAPVETMGAADAEKTHDAAEDDVPVMDPMDHDDAVKPRTDGGMVSTIEDDGDPATTLAQSPEAVDFSTQRLSNAAPVVTDDDADSGTQDNHIVIAGAVSGARGAATPPQSDDLAADDETPQPAKPAPVQSAEDPAPKLEVPVTKTQDAQPEVTQTQEAKVQEVQVADVAALRSVRSQGLLGSDDPVRNQENIFRLPAARGSDVDDLKRIRGIGVLIEKKLNAMGVRTYEQIANWTAGDVNRVSDTLDFKGRIERESWIEQARILSSGGFTEFSKRG